MKRSILITDDEQTIREALSLFLSEEGFVCEVAKGGQEAVEKARCHPYDVVLMDLHMPRQNGIQALQKIKEYRPSTIIIILTAYYDVEDAATALQKGASTLLLKPIDFEELLDTIHQHLAIKNS